MSIKDNYLKFDPISKIGLSATLAIIIQYDVCEDIFSKYATNGPDA